MAKVLVLSKLGYAQREALAVARGSMVSGTFSARCAVCSQNFRPEDLASDPAQANRPMRLRQKVCPRCARLRAKPLALGKQRDNTLQKN